MPTCPRHGMGPHRRAGPSAGGRHLPSPPTQAGFPRGYCRVASVTFFLVGSSAERGPPPGSRRRGAAARARADVPGPPRAAAASLRRQPRRDAGRGPGKLACSADLIARSVNVTTCLADTTTCSAAVTACSADDA
jgi:hypothetical protein